MDTQSEKHSESNGRATTLNDLRNLKNRLEKELRWKGRLRIYMMVIVFTIIPASVISTFISAARSTTHSTTHYNIPYSILINTVIVYGVGGIIGLISITQRIRYLRGQINDTNFEIELAGYDISEREIRAERLFRRNEQELLKYYSMNLAQNRATLLTGIICIAAGIAIAMFTLSTIFGFSSQFTNAEPNLTQASDLDIIWTKGIAAVVGTISTIMVNVVAAIYLQMHSRASDALGQFHQRLVHTNELFLANILASRVDNDQQRLSLLADMAKQIVQGAPLERK